VEGTPKTAHIQIRVSPEQKAELVRHARAAGLDLSSYVLGKAIPDSGARFRSLVRSLSETPRSPFVLAELADVLSSVRALSFRETVAHLPSAKLDDVSSNLLSAMVETRAAKLGVHPPDWVTDVASLDVPWFPTELSSLRLHLLCHSPPAFRRRNLFVDSTLGDRV
jgi:hypothetical protein